MYYQEYKETPSEPIHSYLFSLQPIGLGTPYSECLTSYISRLAEAHKLKVGKFVRGIIIPRLKRRGNSDDISSNANSQGGFFFHGNTKKLNGFTEIAEEVINVLEQLTGINDLQYLTMTPFSNVFSKNRLFKDYKVWCPLCFKEWKDNNLYVYEPLIWTLRSVEICPVHHILLEFECPNCKKRLPLLSALSRLGFCPICQCWLGEVEKSRPITELSLVDITWQNWIIQNIGEALANIPKLDQILSREIINKNINQFIIDFTEGNKQEFANLINVNRTTLLAWTQGCILPEVENSLRICYVTGISLLNFLTEEVKLKERPILKPKLWKETLRDSNKVNKENVEKYLMHVLECSKTPSIYHLSKLLGHRRDTLKRNFPELCQQIIERHTKEREKSAKERRIRLIREVKELILTRPRHMPLPQWKIHRSVKGLHYTEFKRIYKQAIEEIAISEFD